MNNPTESVALFERLGRWITRHNRLTLGIWLVLMSLSLVVSPQLEGALKGAGMGYAGGEARQTELALQRELGISVSSFL